MNVFVLEELDTYKSKNKIGVKDDCKKCIFSKKMTF
ncbi:MAG: hypothetical protein ACJA17_000171 [Polaribacter sp.]|jgi:hypothetical protein